MTNDECRMPYGELRSMTIAPRSTRLIRTADLRGFQDAIRSLIPADPDAARACAVIVPTRTAAEELQRRRTGVGPGSDEAQTSLGAGSPDVVTRDEFYA